MNGVAVQPTSYRVVPLGSADGTSVAAQQCAQSQIPHHKIDCGGEPDRTAELPTGLHSFDKAQASAGRLKTNGGNSE